MVVRRATPEKTNVRRQRQATARPFDIFEYVIKLGKSIPADEIARMPRDGAKHFDHYLDGSSKQA